MNMSCEIPSEICAHLVPVKYVCGRCDDRNRIAELESQIEVLTEKINDLSRFHECNKIDRIERLEKDLSKFQIGNLRENINCLINLVCEPESIPGRPSNFKLKKELTSVSNRDFIESYQYIYNRDTKKLKEKIEELEDFNERQVKWNQHINERIEKLEQLLKSVIETPNIVWAKYHKTPHKCPVCNGSKKTMFTFPSGAYWEEECKSCEGKGIVWG